MASEEPKVALTGHEAAQFDLNDPRTIQLIHDAQDGDAADKKLKIMEAVVKYKKAVFWSVFLSTSLIMEGYDLVLVCF